MRMSVSEKLGALTNHSSGSFSRGGLVAPDVLENGEIIAG
jgi:hypothetical protein